MKIIKLSSLLLLQLTVQFVYAQNKIITHIIKPKETISSLSRLYNVNVNEIYRLNNINDRTILHIGQKIIISINGKTTTPQVVEKPAVKSNLPNSSNQYLVVAGDNLSKIAKQFKVTEQQLMEWNGLKSDAIRAGSYLNVSNTNVLQKQQQITVKNEPKTSTQNATPEKFEKVIEPSKKIETTTSEVKKIVDEKVVDKYPEKTIETKALTTKPSSNNVTKTNEIFENQFISTQNSIEGTSGTFKTIAGWQDKKYYILLNNVESGKIVKITANNKICYAKVLGPLPNIKEDNKFSMRISNAAAAALGFSDNSFKVKVEY